MSQNTIMNENTRLLANDGSANDRFGRSVSVNADGTVALIGSTCNNVNGVSSGSVYVFTKSEGVWVEQAKLAPNDGAPYDWFGCSVSLSADGTVALVGADWGGEGDTASGVVYVFALSRGEWIQQARLVPSDGASFDYFGASVSLNADGTVALIGAIGNDDNGVDSGSMYVFTQNNGAWTQQAKLLPSDGANGDWFGISVSVSADGTVALIGAHYKNDNGVGSGSAYVFVKDGEGAWAQQAKLLPDDGAPYDWFGWSVSVNADGTMALIGVYGNNGNGANSGSAYVFTCSKGKWTQQAKLLANDGDACDWFGWSVSVNADGTVALIGACGDDVSGTMGGSAYIFTRSGEKWTQQAKLLASDGGESDEFGWSVSASADGTMALIGAPNANGIYSGSVYVFDTVSAM